MYGERGGSPFYFMRSPFDACTCKLQDLGEGWSVVCGVGFTTPDLVVSSMLEVFLLSIRSRGKIQILCANISFVATALIHQHRAPPTQGPQEAHALLCPERCAVRNGNDPADLHISHSWPSLRPRASHPPGRGVESLLPFFSTEIHRYVWLRRHFNYAFT